MSEGLLIKGTTTITNGATFSQNQWQFSNRKLTYAIYQDGDDRLNNIIIKLTASVNVKNLTDSSRTINTGVALQATAVIRSKPQGESGVQIGIKTFSLPASSETFASHESKTITGNYSVVLGREEYDKVYAIVSAPSGSGQSALNTVSGFQINLPGLKELVGNSNRRITFTSGGTKYGITNMY